MTQLSSIESRGVSLSQFCLHCLSLHRHVICSLKTPEISFGSFKGEPYLKKKKKKKKDLDYWKMRNRICYFPCMDIIYFNLQSSFGLNTSGNKQ